MSFAQTLRADALSGLYVGGSFGRAQNDYQTAFVDDQYQQAAKEAGDTLKFTSSSVRRTDDTWWVNTGYLPWSYFGFEAAFIHLGELTHRASGTLEAFGGDKPVITTASITSHGPALSLLARIPMTDALDVDLRVGDYLSKTTLTHGFVYESKYSANNVSASASSLLAGVGAAYTFLGHWSIRLDYLRIERAGDGNSVGKYNANLATVGAAFTF
jgi:hypothetical protein